jgi:hypothetical protein
MQMGRRLRNHDKGFSQQDVSISIRRTLCDPKWKGR